MSSLPCRAPSFSSVYVRVFVSCRPSQDITTVAQWLKGLSSRILLQEFPHMRKPFWGRQFWARRARQ